MKTLFYFLALCVIGCTSAKKYQKSDQFVKDCAQTFPVKTDSIYIEGELVTDTVTEVVYLDGDTIVQVIEGITTKFITKDRIINKVVTINKTDTILKRIENTALVKSLVKDIEKLELDNATQKLTIHRRTKERNIGFGIIGVAGIYLFRHQLLGLLGGLPGFLAGIFRRRKK